MAILKIEAELGDLCFRHQYRKGAFSKSEQLVFFHGRRFISADLDGGGQQAPELISLLVLLNPHNEHVLRTANDLLNLI